MECKKCHCKNVSKMGTQMTRKFGRLQRYQCQDCGHIFLMPMDSPAKQ